MNKDLSSQVADIYEQFAREGRTSYLTVLQEAAKNRIDVLRDYTILALSILGAMITMLSFGFEDGIVRCPSLFAFGAFIMAIVVVLCFISRNYYIDEIDGALLSNEKYFRQSLELIAKLRLSESDKERIDLVGQCTKLERTSVQSKRPHFLKKDVDNIGYILFLGILVIAASFLV